MKKLLILFLIALAVFSVQAQEKPKMGFMELFITWVDDASKTRSNEPGDDFLSKTGFINVFDADITIPIVKSETFGVSIWQMLEWVVDAGSEKTKPNDTFSAFTWIFQPQLTFGKHYKMNTGVRTDASVRFDFAGAYGLAAKSIAVDVFSNNNISIPKMMEIWINLYGMWNYAPANPPAAADGFTTIELVPAWSIGGPGLGDNWHFQGSIWQGDDQFWFHYVGPQYANGIGWSLAQEFHLNLEPQFSKDGDSNANETLLNSFVLSNYGIFLWDIMKLTKNKDLSLTLLAAEDVEVTFPYSSGAEQQKSIETSGLYGAELGIKGFQFGFYVHMKTQDSYNASLGYNESAGNDTAYYGTGAGSRAHGTGQIGPSVKLQYFGNGIGFRLTYVGLGQFRDYNDKSAAYNGLDTWTNSIRTDFFLFF